MAAMPSPPKVRDRLPQIATLPLAQALTAAAQVLTIERTGAVSEPQLAATERALGVSLPADYRDFVREGGGMRAQGDPDFGFGQLTAFGPDELAERRDQLLEWFPGCTPCVIPLLLLGDEIEKETLGVGLDGRMYTVCARDEEIYPAGAFASALVEGLGEVIVRRPAGKPRPPPQLAVATFSTTDEADAFLRQLDEADAGQAPFDFISKADEKRLEIALTAGGKQVLVLHPSPRRFDEERFAEVCRAARATEVLTSADRVRVNVRSKTHRALADLEQVFYAEVDQWPFALIEHDSYSDVHRSKPLAGCHHLLRFESKTVGRVVGLSAGAEAWGKLVRLLLAILRHKAARDWEVALESNGRTSRAASASP